MMAMDDPSSGLTDEASSVWPLLRGLLAAVLAIASLGAAVGAGSALADDASPSTIGYAIVAAFALIAIGSAVYAWRQTRSLFVRAQSPRVRRSRTMLIVSALIGSVLGAALVLTAGPGAADRGALAIVNAPLPLWLAIASFALFGIAVPWISWVWHRNVDEHEARAYRDGAMLAAYAYVLLSMLWWTAWKAQLSDAPNGYVIFAAMMTVWTVVWAWRRYR